MIITLSLNPSIDYILQVPEIRLEDTLRAEYDYFQSGGKGINVSRVLTRLGIANEAWGFCGGDTGKWLRSFLNEEHVLHRFIETTAETRINIILTEQSTQCQLRVSAPGNQIKYSEERALVECFHTLPVSTQWVSLGGSLPPGISPGITRKLIEACQEKGVPVVLDADGDTLKDGLQGRPCLIKPNQYELERLLDRPVRDMKDIIHGARSVIHEGLVEMVVTSLADAGAVLVTKDLAYYGKAPKVPVISKVGAGDSMVAGLLKGFIDGKSLEDTLRIGIAAGTAAVMTPGTELCLKHDFESLLPQVTVELVTEANSLA